MQRNSICAIRRDNIDVSQLTPEELFAQGVSMHLLGRASRIQEIEEGPLSAHF